MFRWIVILLIVALPIRSAMAGAQICPWMALDVVASASAADLAQPMQTMGDECPGMTADGHCALQVACTATPILTPLVKVNASMAITEHAVWHAVYSLTVFLPTPLRVPIALS
jgi:hypothetical protein